MLVQPGQRFNCQPLVGCGSRPPPLLARLQTKPVLLPQQQLLLLLPPGLPLPQLPPQLPQPA